MFALQAGAQKTLSVCHYKGTCKHTFWRTLIICNQPEFNRVPKASLELTGTHLREGV